MAYIYVCHVCLYVFMPFACYMCANGCKLVQMYAPLHITQLAQKLLQGVFCLYLLLFTSAYCLSPLQSEGICISAGGPKS